MAPPHLKLSPMWYQAGNSNPSLCMAKPALSQVSYLYPPTLVGGGGCQSYALTMLPRRLLPRLPEPMPALWQRASKPRMPPTPSPISTTCGGGMHQGHGRGGGGGSWAAPGPWL